MSETSFEQQDQEERTDDEGVDAAAEGDGEPTGSAGARSRDLSFGSMANRNLQRARKSIATKGDGGTEDLAQFLVQAATVYAILDLADAVRNQGK